MPDCALSAACPELALDPALCVDDPDLFEVDSYGDFVANVTVDADEVEKAKLAPGTWHTTFADPMGGCELVVVAFTLADDGGVP